MDDCLCGTQVSSGSLAGAAHALNDNACVLRCAGCVHKSQWDQKGKSLLDFYTFCTNTNRESSCDVVLCSARQQGRRQDDPSYCRHVVVARVNMVVVLSC